jgi:hypothetical protein
VGHEPLRVCHLSCRRRLVHPSVDDIPFDFLREDEEGVSGFLSRMRSRREG